MSEHEQSEEANLNNPVIKVRGSFIQKIATQFTTDCDLALIPFPDSKKTELIEHIFTCFKLTKEYFEKDMDDSIWEKYVELEDAFLKKHGTRLKYYKQRGIGYYYTLEYSIVHASNYWEFLSTDEFNEMTIEEQKLSKSEMEAFFYFIRNYLNSTKQFLLLNQSPEDEVNQSVGTLNTYTITKPLRQRTANDNRTCLNQAQTVLLMYYLQQMKVIQKDENLSDKEAAVAFEILTGYSQNTLRQDFGKFHLYQTKVNLTEIDNLLTRMKIAIGKDLKESR